MPLISFTVGYADRVKRKNAQKHLADDKSLIDHADLGLAAVGRCIAVIAHDEHAALGNGLRSLKIELVSRRLGDIRLVKQLAVNIHSAAVKVDLDRLPFGCDNALYKCLGLVLILAENYDIALLWLIKKRRKRRAYRRL